MSEQAINEQGISVASKDLFKQGLVDFYSSQAEVILAQYRNINQLLGETKDWTAPGTHCEVLIRDFLRRNLPSGLSVDKGFVYGQRIVDGAIRHCPEIDILIHDSLNYRPVFRLEDFVIVQAEAVRAVIQVKRSLTSGQLKSAIENVVEAKRFVRECKIKNQICPFRLEDVFSAVVMFEDRIEPPENKPVSDTYKNRIGQQFSVLADWYTMPNYIGSLDKHSFFFNGFNVNKMHYDVFDSVHDGKHVGLQGFLARLSLSILPFRPPFEFPIDYKSFHHFVFYENPNPPMPE